MVKIKPENQKTKGERLKESIEILKKLIEVGIAQTDPGYQETKKYLDEWIQTGESRTYKYYLHRYARKVELILPLRKNVVPTCHLFAPDPEKLKEYEESQKEEMNE